MTTASTRSMLIKLLVERTGRPILSTLVISSRSIITKPNSDPYSDPYHGKTGRHALTSHKIYFSKKLGIAVLSGTWRDAPADGKIQYIPVRIPPSPPQKATLFVENRVVFLLFSAVFQRIKFALITTHFSYTPNFTPNS